MNGHHIQADLIAKQTDCDCFALVPVVVVLQVHADEDANIFQANGQSTFY